MKMKNKIPFLLFAIIIINAIALITSYAHPGKTDSSGGHYDNATGEYHYHHGYPPHQHTNGICPYNYDDRTNNTSIVSSESLSKSINDSKPAIFSKSSKNSIFALPLIVFLGISIYICHKQYSEKDKYKNKLLQAEQELFILKKDYEYLRNYFFHVDLRKASCVPDDIYFDKYRLPHKIINGNDIYTVYINQNGQKYHCKKGCSGASNEINLLKLSDDWQPCFRCAFSTLEPLRNSYWYSNYISLVELRKKYIIETKDLRLLIQDWDHILCQVTRSDISAFNDSKVMVENDYTICIKFDSEKSYSICSHPFVLEELENIIFEEYQIEVYIKACKNIIS